MNSFMIFIRSLILFVAIFFMSIGSSNRSIAQNGMTPEDRMKMYNVMAKDLLDEFKYDSAILLVNMALKEQENALSYCYLCHIYGMQKDWEQSALYGEKSMEMDPGILPLYPDLFFSYLNSRKWDKALSVAEKAKIANPDMNIDMHVIEIEAAKKNDTRSEIITWLLITAIAAAFAVPIINRSKRKRNYFTTRSNVRFSEILLISMAVSCVLYMVFYALSKKIWSINPPVDASKLTSIMCVSIYERDGIEKYVLFIMMFLNLGLTLWITDVLRKYRTSRLIYITTYLLLFCMAAIYILLIGFYPPISPKSHDDLFIVVLTTGLICIITYCAYIIRPWLALLILLPITAYAALLPFCNASAIDLLFIFGPALRLIHGFKVSETYFQYDLLLSYLAAVWMKLNFSLASYNYLSYVSYFFLFAGSYFFGERFFKTKGLSIFLIIALIIVRRYGQGDDEISVFQVSPIRLDLWIIMLLIVNKYGIRHWLAGAFLGSMILFHRNLGVIYTICYFGFTSALFIVDIIDAGKTSILNMTRLRDLLLAHIRLNIVNAIIIVFSVALCYVLFHEFFSTSVLVYNKFGLGMLPIYIKSFYWYMPIIVGCAGALLFFYKRKLGTRYFNIGLLILFLTIGNSIYFFGRSHENNILNISAILLLILFLVFDIIISLSKRKHNSEQQKFHLVLKENYLLLLPFLFVLFTGYIYADRISTKISAQYGNLSEGRLYRNTLTLENVDTLEIKQLTNHSDKVYFLDIYGDVYDYYYGGYTPVGYFSPSIAYIYRTDFIRDMQHLLDSGYYIVTSAAALNTNREYLTSLNYNKVIQNGDNNLVIYRNDPVKLLLPREKESSLHVGLLPPLGHIGVDLHAVRFGEEFTLELILKPQGIQVENATVLNNVTKYDFGYAGMTFQNFGNVQDSYLFSCGVGMAQMAKNIFKLENGKWSYITILAGKKELKTYINGLMVASTPTDGMTYLNSDLPLLIGNSVNRLRPFNGLIKEVKITNGLKTEEEIRAIARALAIALPI